MSRTKKALNKTFYAMVMIVMMLFVVALIRNAGKPGFDLCGIGLLDHDNSSRHTLPEVSGNLEESRDFATEVRGRLVAFADECDEEPSVEYDCSCEEYQRTFVSASKSAELLSDEAKKGEVSDDDGSDFKPFSAIKTQISPFSIAVIDFYNSDYVCRYESSYGMLASVSYLRRFSEYFSLEGGLGYTLALQNGALSPENRDFHYMDAKAIASVMIPLLDSVDLSFGLGAGFLVHMGADVINPAPEMLAHSEVDIDLASSFSLGFSFDFSLSFIPMKDRAKSSLTALIHPFSIVGEFLL